MKFLSFLFLFFIVFFVACVPGETPIGEVEEEEEEVEEVEEVDTPHEHVVSEWIYEDVIKCGKVQIAIKQCVDCLEVLETKEYTHDHDFYQESTMVDCVSRYRIYTRCHNCDYEEYESMQGAGHVYDEYVVLKEPTETSCGIKSPSCSVCHHVSGAELEFAGNTFSYHGKLSVVGPDLVDKHGEKFQLIGLSTHGLQWFGRYVNYDSFKAIKDEFGINVIRLAMYTAEDGYVTGNATRKQYMYDTVCKGIEIATELDMYVIIDWHMVGATLPSDKNPLTFVNEAMEFFDKISSKYKDYDNVIYEIMNEPNGPTTWDDCSEYANKVIPMIRKNTDGIILVGNPSWSANLTVVMEEPLDYPNIMYTYHFYAADHKLTNQVITAYDAGFPVFISEHGGMESSGDGKMDYASIRNWYRILDERNISYVAWNISNSKGSASILLQSNTSLTNFSDSGLKVWGRWFKIWTRSKANLTVFGIVDEDKEF